MRRRCLDISSSACRFLTRRSTSSSKAAAAALATPSPDFEPRRTFPLPSTVPSWYAGHMYRAMRSLPALLARNPPPLIIEARDARLPITSINPAFERVMQDTFGSSSQQGKGKAKAQSNDWESRRLVVYTHRDLVEPSIEKPLVKAFEEHGKGQQVMFVDTRSDNDVRRVIRWINKQAKALVANPPPPARMTRELARTLHRLSGAFKHTPTPEDGVRLVIVGMPNVGKSSLLNALRRVGAGKGKAASTAPTPGHTRKLTGTVRITKDVVKETAPSRSGEAAFQLDRESSSASSSSSSSPPVYVYDTPGVMVPFLGRGRQGAEKGVKLAVAAGIKSSLFDTQGLADYLLYRLNLRYDWEKRRWLAWKGDMASSSSPPIPEYLSKLPMPGDASLGPTNDIEELLSWAAMRAPGSLLKGGERDLEGTADFILQRWREGKLGDCELDLGLKETQVGATEALSGKSGVEAEDDDAYAAQIDRVVREHFEGVEEAQKAGADREAWKRPPRDDESGHDYDEVEGAEDVFAGSATSSLHGKVRKSDEAPRSPRGGSARPHSDDTDHSLISSNQNRLRKKINEQRERRERLRARGVLYDDRDPLKREREKHKRWLIRMGKLKVHGARSGRAARAGAR